MGVRLEERFWSKVDRRGSEECWTWLGADNGQGYGKFSLHHGSVTYAHRLAYQLLVGPIPNGLHIDHLCRNPRCVNPSHLEPVTNAENRRRGKQGHVTHCPRGHEYAGGNLYIDRKGGRRCRACHRDRMAGRIKGRAIPDWWNLS